MLGTSWLATRFRRKGLVICGTSIQPIVSTGLMLTVLREHKGVLLFGHYPISYPASYLQNVLLNLARHLA